MKWINRPSCFQGSSINVDPLADWLFRPHHHPGGGLCVEAIAKSEQKGERFPVLIRLKEGKTAERLSLFWAGLNPLTPTDPIFGSATETVTAEQWQTEVLIPDRYLKRDEEWSIGSGARRWNEARYCTANVRARFFRWLAEHSEIGDFIESVTISAPPTPLGPRGIEEEGRVEDKRSRTSKESIVMAVIDDGLCLASERFRDHRGDTRLLSAWLQDIPGSDKAPPGYRYGRELHKDDIDGKLGPLGDDEDLFYREIGLFDPTRQASFWSQQRVTHATHVLDRAAGFHPTDLDANDLRRPIIAVQLPESVVADGSGHSLGAFVLDGLRYIVESVERGRTDKGSKRSLDPAPVVVTISYGNNAGPHDGKSDLEQAMDEVVEIWADKYPNVPFVIVLPAGNSFQGEGHARLTAAHFSGDTPQTLSWKIHPDDGTASLVEIWLPPDFPDNQGDRCSLQIKTPYGQFGLVSTNGDVAELIDDDGYVLAQGVYCPPRGGRTRGMFQVIIGPTVEPAIVGLPGRQPAPHGIWQLTLAANGLAVGAEIHAWIQRDDLPRNTLVVARQSWFVDENYRRVDADGFPLDTDDPYSFVKRQGSLNAIATGSRCIIVGASYERRDMSDSWPATALYSGGGLTGGPGVDLVATAEESVVLNGIRGAGTRSGACVRMNGTSVAAPAAARAIADRIAASRSGAFNKAEVPTVIEPPRRGQTAPAVRDPRKGFGRLKKEQTTEVGEA